jgi:3-oxoisoapionate decarboxylase
MKIGISTYAFFWQWSDLAVDKLSLKDMIHETKKYGGELFQICDYPLIEEMTEQELADISSYAKSLDVELELGTKGIHPSVLKKYLSMAKIMDVKMIRSMVYSNDYRPSPEQATQWLTEMMPSFQQQGVTLALETYEQMPTDSLLEIIKEINHPNLGICLDPANTIATLEMPNDVIHKTAPYVVNLHVKDFHFTRNQGWVGFSLTGTSLGQGQLDFNYLIKQVYSNPHQPNAVLEFWLNFSETIEETIQLEKEWIANSLDYLRRELYVSNS